MNEADNGTSQDRNSSKVVIGSGEGLFKIHLYRFEATVQIDTLCLYGVRVLYIVQVILHCRSRFQPTRLTLIAFKSKCSKALIS